MYNLERYELVSECFVPDQLFLVLNLSPSCCCPRIARPAQPVTSLRRATKATQIEVTSHLILKYTILVDLKFHRSGVQSPNEGGTGVGCLMAGRRLIPLGRQRMLVVKSLALWHSVLPRHSCPRGILTGLKIESPRGRS